MVSQNPPIIYTHAVCKTLRRKPFLLHLQNWILQSGNHGIGFFWNVRIYLPEYMATHIWRQYNSSWLLWDALSLTNLLVCAPSIDYMTAGSNERRVQLKTCFNLRDVTCCSRIHAALLNRFGAAAGFVQLCWTAMQRTVRCAEKNVSSIKDKHRFIPSFFLFFYFLVRNSINLPFPITPSFPQYVNTYRSYKSYNAPSWNVDIFTFSIIASLYWKITFLNKCKFLSVPIIP